MCIHIYIFEASSACLVQAGLELLFLLFLNFLFYFNLFFYVCMLVNGYVSHSGGQRQLAGVSVLLWLCGSWEPNMGL